MRLVVSTEHHFALDPNGIVSSETGGREYGFWQRYLAVFDSVTVLGRLRQVVQPLDGNARADGEGVEFLGLPDYQGMRGYLQNYTRIKKRLRGVVDRDTAYLVRLPGLVGESLVRELKRQRLPYGVEVVADPYDVFAPGSVHHPLRPLMRAWFTRELRRAVGEAAAVAYVTRDALQQRYPAHGVAFTTSYSSISLKKEHFSDRPKSPPSNSEKPVHMVTVGSLEQLYKGTDVLLDAMAQCVERGLDLKLRVVGEGRFRTFLQERAAEVGLGHRVEFLGYVPAGNEVRAVLDEADLFVLPSRTEGLPRAMIEAMARGLPCIGTEVGGIPELIASSYLAPADDAGALADMIGTVVKNPDLMGAMAKENYEKASEYRDDVLDERRIALYRAVRERTEKRGRS